MLVELLITESAYRLFVILFLINRIMKHLLFSYGTLQLEKVQLENYGRLLHGAHDRIIGYKLDRIRITDKEVLRKSNQEFHPIAIRTDYLEDTVEGMVFEITDEELQKSDDYEVADYKRVLATCESGKQVWAYVSK